MASLLPFLALFFVMISTTSRALKITLNSTLSPAANQSSWMSNSGLYAFGFYKKGNGYAIGIYVAGVPETVVWTFNRNGPPIKGNATLLFNGNLVVQSPPDEDINMATLSEAATSASMLDSGNFVLYNAKNQTIWQSFDSPTDTLLPGQHLSGQLGQELVSSASKTDQSTGLFLLKMQQDGNLVQYPSHNSDDFDEYSYWSSATAGGENVTLILVLIINMNT